MKLALAASTLLNLALLLALPVPNDSQVAFGGGKPTTIPATDERFCADANGDGEITIDDPILTLNYLFLGRGEPYCVEDEISLDPGFPSCANEVGRFVDNGDGTVTDTCIGLMWSKGLVDFNGDGEIQVIDDWGLYSEAAAAIQSATVGGYTDWRFPTIGELFTILDHSEVHPFLHEVFEPLNDVDRHWTSTVHASPNFNWAIDFESGRTERVQRDEFDQGGVRVVREISTGTN